jgi:hypothetical protein
MIKDVIKLLMMNEYYGISKNVDIAKGIYKIPTSFSDARKQVKRIVKSKR